MERKIESPPKVVSKSPLFPSTRLSVYLLLNTVGILNVAVRFSLNMSIVCMVVPPQQHSLNATQDLAVNHTIPHGDKEVAGHCEHATAENRIFGYEGEFTWSRSQVGYILSGYYYGYVAMQVLSGWLADRFGVRHVVGVGTLIGGILSLLTPLAARVHYGLLIALRLVMGFVMGTIFPSFNSFIGKWVPLGERITFVGLLLSGPPAGQVIAFALSGVLCQYGWTLIFYILGAIIVVWYIAYMYIVYSSPDEHPRISEAEKAYIMDSNNFKCKGSAAKLYIPWRSILTSRSVLGACVTHFAFMWLLYTVVTGIPLYMQDVLYFNIKSNGALSSLGPLTNLCLSFPVALLLDFLFRRFIKSTFVMRKMCMTVFFLISVGAIMSVGFMQCEQRNQVIVMSALIYFSFTVLRGGITLTPSDIAPRMAGTIFGLMNFLGQFAGILVPIAIGNLTPNGGQAEWQRVFFLTGGLVAIGWLAFIMFVATTEQEWAKVQDVVTAGAPHEEEEAMQLKADHGDAPVASEDEDVTENSVEKV